MTRWTRRHAFVLGGAAALLPVLAACTDAADGEPAEDGAGAGGASDQGGDESPAAPAVDPEEVVETRSLVTGHGEVELALHPVVRAG